jgi:hypothetical protein
MSIQQQLSFTKPINSKNVKIRLTDESESESESDKDSKLKMPVCSPLIQKQLQDPLVIEYMAQLSEMELVAFEVASSHLPMFNIIKCNGFRKWKKDRD